MWTVLGRLILWLASRFAPWLVGLATAVLAAQFDLFKKLLYFIFDEMLGVVVLILNGVDVQMPAYNPSSLMASLPGDMLAAMVDLRVPEAMAIVFGAYAIRFLLQLIPFTRLGS